MRHAIDWRIFVATREDDWSRAIYDDARSRGHGKYRALRGRGTRWMRILWNDRTTYDPDHHHRIEVAAAAA